MRAAVRDSNSCKQPETFRRQRGNKKSHARDIAARPVEAGNEAELDRIAANRKDDRDRA